MQETSVLLKDLVALPSINPMGRPLQGPEIHEHRVTDYLENFFRSLEVPYERQPITPLRDNILACYTPPDPQWTLLLEVHQDTVPVDRMTIDPFGAHIEGDRLYGRGACDVKGGMAAMLGAFARMARERPRTGVRVVLACTVDEEHLFIGVQRLVKSDLTGGLAGPVLAVVAEPTELNIINAHKGAVRWFLDTSGRSCHSARPDEGINAIYRMGHLLPHIQTFAEQLQTSRQDPRLGPPTLSVGMIGGGTSVNTVPDRCRIEIDRRVIPGEDARSAPEDLARYLREKVSPQVEFDTNPPYLLLPALGPAGSEPIAQKLGQAINSVVGSHEVQAVPYGTDASPLAEAGIPAVVFGPGNIQQAHTCDEWISLEQVAQASEILYRLACTS